MTSQFLTNARCCSYIMPPIILNGWVFMQMLRRYVFFTFNGYPFASLGRVTKADTIFFRVRVFTSSRRVSFLILRPIAATTTTLKFPNDAHDQGESSSPCVTANTLIKAAAFIVFMIVECPLKLIFFTTF